jgi:small subunit ribosomal protein S1
VPDDLRQGLVRIDPHATITLSDHRRSQGIGARHAAPGAWPALAVLASSPWKEDREGVTVSEPEEDFAALLEKSFKAKRIEKGQTIEGRIVAIGPEVALVDVGGKGEAAIDVAELKDESGVLEAAVGDRVQAVVTSTTGGLTLSRKIARGAATARQLEDAFQTALPVQGTVEREVKGGYEVRIARQRAFCPFSQIDVGRSEPATHIGRTYAFRITEYRDSGRSIVVSRRALLEAEQREAAAEVRRSLVAGAVLTGRVASVRPFGAFVDLGGGVQGLLHISEMGWSRVADASEVVAPGESITVKVLRVGDGGEKIALGLKQLSDDPWLTVHTRYEAGQVITGRITRLAEFGAFVELEPGVEALAHVSTFAPTGRSGGWAAAMAPGTTGTFEILSVDPDKRRIGLSIKAIADAQEAAEVREYNEREATPQKFGSLGDKLRGALEPGNS